LHKTNHYKFNYQWEYIISWWISWWNNWNPHSLHILSLNIMSATLQNIR